jgi:hypothetical protein
MGLAADQRQALDMLADAGPRGCTEAIMAAHFGIELLARLVREGLACVEVESVRAGGRTVDVVRMKITDDGRQAIAQ